MKLFEIKNGTPGEYVYHASMLTLDTKDLQKIAKRGLIPSERGYAGSGVYFGHTPDQCYVHVDKEDAVLFRAKWKDLVNLYGKYSENETGIQWDEDEIVVPGKVPAELLEVEYFKGEWWDLESAVSASKGPDQD